MKTRLVALSICLGLFALAGAVRETQADLPGCMKCHGDETAMKAMVTHLVLVCAGGEG